MAKKEWKKYGLAFASSVVYLLAAAIVIASSGGAHGEGAAPSKLPDLLYRTMNFGVLAGILFATLRKPIVNGLNRRRDSIRLLFEDLENKKSDAESLYRENEKKLAGIDDEVKKILGAAVAQGEAEKHRIIEDAKRSAVDIKRQAEMNIQHELAVAKRQLREEIAGQAVAMAEELIRKNLRPSDHIKLVDNYLSKVGGLT